MSHFSPSPDNGQIVIPYAVPMEPLGNPVSYNEALAALVSLAFHMALIVVLGTMFLPKGDRSHRVVLEASVAARASETMPETIPLMQRVAPPVEMMQTVGLTTHAHTVTAANFAPKRQATREEVVGEAQPTTMAPPITLARAEAPHLKSTKELLRESGVGTVPAPRPGKPQRKRTDPMTGIVAAQGTDDAVDKVLAGVQKEWGSGDLLVVWLFDASLSLVDDRQLVAAKLDTFYRGIAEKQGKPHVLMSAGAAFGQGSMEVQPLIRYGVRLAKAVAEEVPVDPTGLENTMTAVRECVAKYRRTWKENMLIVVWTDESGDDILQLEDTIALCRRENVGVSIVGPTAVFGSERGFHPYTDIPTGYRFLLPVKRGPDTSFPERMPLPFWHETALRPWSQQGALIDTGGPWFGGAYREGLLSGVGPYALTRLAMETGGTFTLLDPEGDARPFDFENVRNYLPDYVSAAEYLRQVQYSPLRRAVFEAVQLSFKENQRFVVPKLSFISGRSEFYPFSQVDFYRTPTSFRVDLKDEFRGETARCAEALVLLEQAVAFFGPEGMEKEYEREKSLRWKAWYDLTLGRLLATSVRHVEYVNTCKLVFDNAAFLDPPTNHLKFVPSSQLLTTDERVRRAATEAERLLRRCVEKNPGTPFALLAQWELDHPLGLAVRQIVIPEPVRVLVAPVGLPSPAPVPQLPRF